MEIFAVNIAKKLNNELYDKFLSLVDDDKRKKISEFKNSTDVIRGLMSDILIRSVLCNKLKICNEKIKYDYNIYGKPKLKDNNNIHFNISHSGNWVVCIIGERPVGIDIEEVCSIDYINITKRFFSQDEYSWLLAQKDDEKLECFYKLWTLKESYTKMLGKGLLIPFNSFSISFDLENNIYVKRINNNVSKEYFRTYTIDKKYMIAVCAEEENIFSVDILSYDELYKNIFAID